MTGATGGIVDKLMPFTCPTLRVFNAATGKADRGFKEVWQKVRASSPTAK
jgi:large subunit ribosomal protein L24